MKIIFEKSSPYSFEYISKLIANSMLENNLMVIVSCSSKKIWNSNPDVEKFCMAKDAYTGQLFEKFRIFNMICMSNKQFHYMNWKILSAKYGLIEPSQMIENYNITFSKKYSEENKYIDYYDIGKEFTNKHIEHFTKYGIDHKIKNVMVWGGGKYIEYIKKIILTNKKLFDMDLIAPFKGYRIGEALNAANRFNDAMATELIKYR